MQPSQGSTKMPRPPVHRYTPVLPAPAALMIDMFAQMILGFILITLYQSARIPDTRELDVVVPASASRPSTSEAHLVTLLIDNKGQVRIEDREVPREGLEAALSTYREQEGDILIYGPMTPGHLLLDTVMFVQDVTGRQPKLVNLEPGE